jgi:hydroxyacylglutathione hydrolase
MMELRTVRSEGLAHNSYRLFDQAEAVVIDPRRDCKVYPQLARQECAKIKYILETYRNEDYVVGSLELKALAKQKSATATVCNSNMGNTIWWTATP